MGELIDISYEEYDELTSGQSFEFKSAYKDGLKYENEKFIVEIKKEYRVEVLAKESAKSLVELSEFLTIRDKQTGNEYYFEWEPV